MQGSELNPETIADVILVKIDEFTGPKSEPIQVLLNTGKKSHLLLFAPV